MPAPGHGHAAQQLQRAQGKSHGGLRGAGAEAGETGRRAANSRQNSTLISQLHNNLPNHTKRCCRGQSICIAYQSRTETPGTCRAGHRVSFGRTMSPSPDAPALTGALAEQLAELRRGANEILTEADLIRKLRRGRPMIVKAGFDPDRARPAPGPHRAAEQDAPVPAVRARGGVPDRGLHRDDRRPHRPQHHPSAPHARGDPGQRPHLPAAGVQDPRCEEDQGRLQLALVRHR